MSEQELDPRWEWRDIRTLSDPGPVYIKVRCNHLETVPVRAMDRLTRELGEQGEVVAHLCLTCNQQVQGP